MDNRVSKEINQSSSPSATRSKVRKKTPSYYVFLPHSWTRTSFLQWLRNTHAWFGLSGAFMGLFFAITGIFLDHERALVVHLGKTSSSHLQLEVPDQPPPTPEAFEAWLRSEVGYRQEARIQVVTQEAVEGETGLVEGPDLWKVSFLSARTGLWANYTPGDRFAEVTIRRNNVVRILNEFHKANVNIVGVTWVIIADVIAGAYIFLALTGMLLWTRLHGPRLLALSLILGSTFLGVWFIFRGVTGI